LPQNSPKNRPFDVTLAVDVEIAHKLRYPVIGAFCSDSSTYPVHHRGYLEMAKHKKVLVTGADGFIGSHLTEALVRRGYDVRAFVQYNSLNSWGWLDHAGADVKNQFEIFSGDVRDPNGVRTAMTKCDAVLHLAALIAIPFSYHSPDSYVDTNIKGTLNVLQAARSENTARVIHTSTSEVYGTARYVPIDENHPLQGQSPYSATKIAADQLALSFYLSFNLPVLTIRPFNTYGPRQSARAVIPTIIAQIAAGERKIKLGSLHPTRDFSFVDDTVAGFIAALENNGALGETINLGSNFEVSIGDTAKIIAETMGTNIEILTDDQRLRPEKSEVERLWASNDKAKQLLGWTPQHGGRDGFALGLKKTAAWFQDSANLQKYKTGIYNV
jgi:NAD dependent epimerase/dehydratase